MADHWLQRYNELNDGPTTTGRRSGSEAIRKRVATLLQSGTVPTSLDPPVTSNRTSIHRRNSPSPHSTRSSSRDRRHKPDAKDAYLPPSSSNPIRALKRKKSSSSANLPQHSDRPENGHVDASASSILSASHYYSSRAFSAMARPPLLDSDLSSFSSHKKGRTLVSRHPHHHQHDPPLTRIQNEEDDERFLSEQPVYTGPLAVAEYERMKNEIETLKAALYESKKACKRQTKKCDESKTELNTMMLAMQEKESELNRIKSQNSKNEELLSIIESSVQCQICMDLPDIPFALAPCGHILCLSCLQEWFRKAPPTLDDMDIDPDELTDPHYILMRSKSCPSCRAVVKHRPVPVFMVKAIAVALQNAKPSSSIPAARSPGNATVDADKDDPWKGIFPWSEEDEDDDGHENEDSGMESDSEYEEAYRIWYRRRERRAPLASFDSTDSEPEVDDDEEENDDRNEADDGSSSDDDELYMLPNWAPPSVTVDPTAYNMSEDDPPDKLKLLQRGCTLEMMQNYDIAYGHLSGIVLSLRSLNRLYASDDDSDGGDVGIDRMHRVFLGWNITLEEDDTDGEVFVNKILQDIKATPARWQVTPRRGILGAMDVRRLVRADEVEDYDTTDTEVWIDAEDF